MKIVVTGASGPVGRNIIPALVMAGADVIVVGRDVEKLKQLFPGCVATDYSNWTGPAKDADILVHLAVANTDSMLSPDEIRAVNVDWMLEIAEQSREAGISRFLNVSSVHALDKGNTTAYAKSKREGAERLQAVKGLKTLNVYPAAVYGSTFSGKLAGLNDIPDFLARGLFGLLAAFKPVVHSDRLAEHVLLAARDEAMPEAVLADNKDDNLFYAGVRRAVDVVFALLVLLFLNWALLLIWAIIRFETSGPGLLRQKRVGQFGKPFTLYKFRSMHQGTKQAATHEIAASSITRVGAFLRRTKLDELPQVWNLLRNDMSLIGPRPCLPSQHVLIEERNRLSVLSIKPGITGLAQINDIDMSDPGQLAQWDARYLHLRGLLLDMKIMFATAFGKGQGDRTKGSLP